MGTKSRHVLTISCPDAVGLVAAVTGFLSSEKAFITESAQYGDPATKIFFMRCVFDSPGGGSSIEALSRRFGEIAARFRMTWHLHDQNRRPRVVILVSKPGHCLTDLLHRRQSGTLPIDVPAVLSNHTDHRSLVEWHGIPFHHIEDKHSLGEMLDRLHADLVVLARYMQVLPPDLCRRLEGRCINIHHSFLPSFKGAKPYAQAHRRGVKLIGATAHYVTDDLDEGPIVDQEVERVDHTFGAEALAAVGRDIENVVLARAVRYHVEHRVLLNGNKTVVFR